MASEQQFLTTLSVDAVGNIGVFDTKDGGDVTATPVKHRAGGMGPERVYPVLPVITDITLGRIYEDQRDHTLIGRLLQFSGRSGATVTEQPLDADGHAWGTPRIFRGQLGSVKPGKVDSTSTTPRVWTVDVTAVTVAN